MVSANRTLITNHCFWEVRSSNQAKFWEEAWHQRPKLKENLTNPEVLIGLQDENRILVKNYWTDQSDSQEYTQWHPEPWWSRNLQGEDHKVIYEELSKRKIRLHPGPDKLRWGYRMEGNFSIQEAFQLINELPHLKPDPVWTKICDRSLWPEVSMFLWLVMRGIILTWENLQKRGFTGPSQCILC